MRILLSTADVEYSIRIAGTPRLGDLIAVEGEEHAFIVEEVVWLDKDSADGREADIWVKGRPERG